MQLKEGSELQNGKYRIIRVLGQGGFGITYLAENTFFEKYVAIKEFFPKDFCGRDNTSHLTLGTQNNAETVSKLKDRFLKEAKNIAKLDHPGIIKIHDIFEENNTAYYVMDYIEGENLNEMVKRNGPLSEAKAVEYIRKVGDALDYIHSRNMTHFDVKPANIMVRKKDDQPILIDFGLSKQYDAHGDATSTLMQGVSQGYSPIELYNPGSISSFSPQTDVYSLGATLLFLISGSIPPNAMDIIEGKLSIPINTPSNLQMVISKAMSFPRNKRYETISSFVKDLPSSKVKEDTQILHDYSKHTVHENIIPLATLDSVKTSKTNKSIKNDVSSSMELNSSINRNHKSHSKTLLIVTGLIGLLLVIYFYFFYIGNDNDPKSKGNSIFLAHRSGLSLEEQMRSSSPVEVMPPNYNEFHTNSTLTKPKVKKISQKYYSKVAEANEWMMKNARETNSPLLDAAPEYYEYDKILSSLGNLPVPKELDGKYLRYWKQDSNYNYYGYGSESYSEPIDIRLFITNKENTSILYDYEFDNYIYPPQFIESDRNLVDFEVSNFTLQNDILYFSFSHNTYSDSSYGLNAFISSLDTKTNRINWLSKPLVCNANFIIDGDYIITGYGFTDEPDYLYILDKNNGAIISRTSLANAPELIGINGNHFFVRTYSYEYEFTISN